jgi:uncharacterized protein YkwD
VIKVFGRIPLLAGLLILLSLIRPLVISVHARTSTPPVGLSPDLFLFQEETPTPGPAALTPADVMSAVNNLRLSNGLNALAAHPVLMEVAAEQANALAATEGAIGHERPCGIALGQYLLMKGFPLWGDLSLDGYRSENWVAAGTIEEVMTFWSGDAEHLNTMMSPNRSHIGAAVAFSDQYYVVLETAFQTPTSQHQSTAYDMLTGIPATQAACMGAVTLNSDGSISQYSIPVAVSTARLDGDVVHEVKYGQTLWSLAIEYGITIEQIKRYNNLTTDAIAPGWKLLIQKSATQPAPASPASATLQSTPSSHPFPTPTIGITITDTPATNDMTALAEMGQNRYVVAALIVSFSVLVAGIVGFGRKREL